MKGIDPQEWGNINISQESLNIAAQDAALKSYAHKNKMSRKKGAERPKGTHQSNRKNHVSPPTQLPAESRLVAQLAQDSYLGNPSKRSPI